MGDLTRYFSRWEFDCPHCGTLIGPDVELLDVLERLRAQLGRALVVVSATRCAEYNARVGGIKSSQHLVGRAADIPRGLFRPRDARKAGAHGCGVRGGWVVHVDVTPGRRFFVFDD
jgi:zinc D-Ala-D-Ala carboxypeptidase